MITLVLAGFLWIAPVASVPVNCQDTLVAQDEVVKLLEEEVAALRLALDEKTKEAQARTDEVKFYHELYKMQMGEETRLRKLAFRSNRWSGLKWGLIGFSGGILAERLAE